MTRIPILPSLPSQRYARHFFFFSGQKAIEDVQSTQTRPQPDCLPSRLVTRPADSKGGSEIEIGRTVGNTRRELLTSQLGAGRMVTKSAWLLPKVLGSC